MHTTNVDFEITPLQLKEKLDSAQPVRVVDCRETGEWQIGHLEGARHIPIREIPTRAHAELDPDEDIVVYCHRGVRSADVTMWLRHQGFERAQSLRGGIDQWSRQVDSSVPTY